MNFRPNSKFADYVTNVAFHLSLSRGMCSLLLAIEAEEKRTKGEWWQTEWCGYGMFIPTIRSLESRGLVERRKMPKKHPLGPKNHSGKHDDEMMQLTDAGKLVAQLVKMAGLSHSRINKKRVA